MSTRAYDAAYATRDAAEVAAYCATRAASWAAHAANDAKEKENE